MLEDRAQMDSNCAIPLAQFTTVVGKRSLLHVNEKKLRSEANETFLLVAMLLNRSQ